MASSAAGDSSVQGADDYLQDKYGEQGNHVYLSKTECESMLERVFRTSKTVQYMLESLKLGGCGVGRSFFHVVKCDQEIGGGFSSDHGVLLCHNKLCHYREVELAVAHELIHAYDHCRASNLDLTNCYHHACTEVRAANLSGDCTVIQEFLRGNLWESFAAQHRRCVKRRAIKSVSLNPHCQGMKAQEAVNAVMAACCKDTEPFTKLPRWVG